jgi:hypothetical protein
MGGVSVSVRQFNPYPAYKDSGVEWLGKVPAHWEVKPLRRVTYFQRGHDLPTDDRESGEVPVVSSSGPSSTHCRAIAKAPGIVTGRYGTIGQFYLITQDYWPLNTTLYTIQLHGNDARFVWYMLAHMSHLFVLNSLKSAVPGVDRNDIHPAGTAVPLVTEQHDIAVFLDRATARIDGLVAKKERLIELLQEKRSALITRAVTKGLDPGVPIKDSGVEWLGSIPAHWGAKRLKHLITEPLKYGANEAAELGDRDLPRYVRITDIDEKDGLRDETFKSLPAELASEYLLQDGDLLLARSGATAGKTFLYRSSWGACAYAGYLIRARLDLEHACPAFVRYFMASSSYWQWLSSVFIQATIQNVSAERYASLCLPCPSLVEQREIAAFLDHETSRIDALIGKVRDAINRLTELRTALISAAVTGKIDVRD